MRPLLTRMAPALLLSASALFATNPITTELYTADPAALVYHDSLFLFTGHDENSASTGFVMNDWHVFVTDDLVNYHDYGAMMMPWTTFSSWASVAAYAGHCVEHNGKFYWFVPMIHKNVKVNEGFAIGVAVADHPSGPWTDAIGAALITDTTTNSIALNIDPAIYIDGDDIWLYWGSWSAARRVKLKDSMTELDGSVETVTATGFFEAPWIHYFNGKYYFSYASGYPSTTAYSTSTSLSGPWTYGNVINTVMDNSETNHQAILQYRGQWLFVYHTGDADGGGTYHRSVSVDYLYYNTDGSIKTVERTTTGPSQVDNSLIADGYYKLKAKHSSLYVEDAAGEIIQNTAKDTTSQIWKLEKSADTTRTYSLKNMGTGKYLNFPSTDTLSEAGDTADQNEITIENASVEDGYYLFADYSKDYVGDILDVSTDAGKPMIVWIRTGAQNQTFLFEPTDYTEPPTAIATAPKKYTAAVRIVSASLTEGIQLSSPAPWALYNLNGVQMEKGLSNHVPAKGLTQGLYILSLPHTNSQILLK